MDTNKASEWPDAASDEYRRLVLFAKDVAEAAAHGIHNAARDADTDLEYQAAIADRAKRDRRDKLRESLRGLGGQAQSDYDKTLTTLSSGALGVSFVFIKDVLGVSSVQVPQAAFLAWLCWAGSLTVSLGSFVAGALIVKQVVKVLADYDTDVDEVVKWPNRIMTGVNILAGVLFVAGVVLLAIFAYRNLGAIGAKKPIG